MTTTSNARFTHTVIQHRPGGRGSGCHARRHCLRRSWARPQRQPWPQPSGLRVSRFRLAFAGSDTRKNAAKLTGVRCLKRLSISLASQVHLSNRGKKEESSEPCFAAAVAASEHLILQRTSASPPHQRLNTSFRTAQAAGTPALPSRCPPPPTNRRPQKKTQLCGLPAAVRLRQCATLAGALRKKRDFPFLRKRRPPALGGSS